MAITNSLALAKLRVRVQNGSNFVRTTNGEACSISCLLRLVPRTNDSNPEEEVKVCGGQRANIFRTSIQTSQSSPTWNEEFQWTLASAAEEAMLELSLWDTVNQQARYSSKFIGQAVLSVGKLEKGNDAGFKKIQVDVLSCHTSLANREAKLDIGIVLEDVSSSDTDGVVEHQEVLVEEEQQAGDGLQHRQGQTQLFKEKRATLAAVQGELQRALAQKQKNNANQNVPEKSPKDAKLKHQQRPHTNEIMTEKSSHDARLKQKHQLEQQKSPAHHLHGGKQKKGEVSPLLQIPPRSGMMGSKTKDGEVSPSLQTPRNGMSPSSPLVSAGGHGSESISSSVSPLKITGGSCGQGIGGSPLLSANHVKSKAEIRPNQEDRSTVSLGRDFNSNTNAVAKRPAKHEVAQKQRLTPTGGSISTCSTPSARKTHSEMAAASSREVANTESFASTVEILDRSKATLYGEAKEAVLNSFLKMAPQMKLFKGVDTRLIQSLTSRLSVIQSAGNTTIIDGGTEGHSMFFLITGECHVYLAGKMTAKLQAPCSFGEIALLLGRRSAEVRSSSACIFCELESTHMWEVLNEFPLALETITLTLKALAWEQVNKNKHEMVKVETHSSAIREYQDPLTQLNLSDRHQRILAWHRLYESKDSRPSDIPIVRRSPSGTGRTPSAESASDVRGRFDSAVDQAIGHLDPIQIALEISGVSKHVVSIIQSMKMFEGAPVRAQAQVIAKLVTVNFTKGDVVIQAGTVGTCMYFVDQGRLEVIVDNKRVQEQVSGCFFGEIALLTRQIRTATVVALEDCKLLQLDQDAVWTVFNMFPSMYTTIKTVAAQRLDAGIDQISRESALTSSKIKRKGLAGTRSFRVKFRAPFDRFTPEELGASIRSYFVAGLPKVTFLPGKDSTKFANKKAVYFFTVSEASEIIYKSQLISFVNDGPRALTWQDKDPIRKRFVGTPTIDGSGYQLRNLTFCIYMLNKSMLGSFLKPQLLCKAELELSSVISTPNRKLNLSLPMFTEDLSPRKGSVESVMSPKSPIPQNRPRSPTSTNGSVSLEPVGNVHVTIHASPDVLEPYKLRVPVMTTPASANSHTLSVCDHTGKTVCLLNSRIILPSEKRLDVRSNFNSIIDIVGLDGTFKGQVATDVTAGCYARSRLSNNSDIHWATIKAKKRRHAMFKVDDDFGFKVVPTFQELLIVGVDKNTQQETRTFELLQLSNDREGNQSSIGRVTIGGLSDMPYATVQVSAGEDAIRLIQVAVGICESHRLSPPKPWVHPEIDLFEKGYDSGKASPKRSKINTIP